MASVDRRTGFNTTTDYINDLIHDGQLLLAPYDMGTFANDETKYIYLELANREVHFAFDVAHGGDMDLGLDILVGGVPNFTDQISVSTFKYGFDATSISSLKLYKTDDVGTTAVWVPTGELAYFPGGLKTSAIGGITTNNRERILAPNLIFRVPITSRAGSGTTIRICITSYFYEYPRNPDFKSLFLPAQLTDAQYDYFDQFTGGEASEYFEETAGAHTLLGTLTDREKCILYGLLLSSVDSVPEIDANDPKYYWI